jgi:hypothetical protein
MVFSEQVRAVLQSRERRPDPSKLDVQGREVHQIRLHAEHAYRHARLVGYDARQAVVTTPSGCHAFEVVRLGWNRVIVHGDLTPVTFRAGGDEVSVSIAELAAATLHYAEGKAEGDWRVYSAEAFAAYLGELHDDTEDMARRAALFELLTLVKRDEAESVVMAEAYAMGLELRTAHTVYDPSLVWAHEAAKVAHKLIAEARWAAFTRDPCPDLLRRYNVSAAVSRVIRRNEREGW